MSRRTAEADKAIRAAWEREHELVSKGQGTRDWTPEQQTDILEFGKAYDDERKAFQGQHMRSAAQYPAYQGDPDNIQFLTKEEHFEAHKGNWQTPTNWYYDPIAKQFWDFGEGDIIPCKPINLSNPISRINNCDVVTVLDEVEQAERETSSGSDPPIKDIQRSILTNESVNNPTASPLANQVPKGTVIEHIKNAANAVKEFSDAHPVLTTVVEVGVGLAITAIAGKAIDTKVKTRHPGGTSHSPLLSQAIETAGEAVAVTVSSFDFKKSESFLKKLGYTVAKNIDLSDADRQKILQRMITSGIMTKEAVCACLEKYINLHKNQHTFSSAVSKWIADLEFIKVSYEQL